MTFALFFFLFVFFPEIQGLLNCLYLLVIVLVRQFRDICGICCFRYLCDFVFWDLEAQTLKYLFQYFISYSLHLYLNCILHVFTVPKGIVDIQRQSSVTFFILLLRSSSFLDLTLLDSFSLAASDRLLGASEFTSLSSVSFSPKGTGTSKTHHNASTKFMQYHKIFRQFEIIFCQIKIFNWPFSVSSSFSSPIIIAEVLVSPASMCFLKASNCSVRHRNIRSFNS